MFKELQALQTGNFADFVNIPITMEGGYSYPPWGATVADGLCGCSLREGSLACS